MARECTLGRMEGSTREIIGMIRSMDLVLMYGLMEEGTKGNGEMVSKAEREL